MGTESVVALGFYIGSTGAVHASVTQKAKNIKSIFVPVPISRGFLLSVVTLAAAHENTGMFAT